MGVYAETSGATISCKDSKSAEAVYKALKKQASKSDEHGNDYAQDLEQDGSIVYFRASSGRIQNLEWQMGEVWEAVKGIAGVENMSAPFLVEGEGAYYENE